MKWPSKKSFFLGIALTDHRSGRGRKKEILTFDFLFVRFRGRQSVASFLTDGSRGAMSKGEEKESKNIGGGGEVLKKDGSKEEFVL